MSTANFHSMTDFPLIVAEDEYRKYCPECGLGNCGDSDKCEDCGCDLTDVEAVYDDLGMADMIGEMERAAKRMNEAQDFYTVTVQSGYYSGVQFYVDEKYWKLEDMDNEESREEFGMCRSKMLRKYKVAGNMIRRELRKAREDLGLMEIVCTARFSNGEAMYTRVDRPMSDAEKIRVAVKAAIAA